MKDKVYLREIINIDNSLITNKTSAQIRDKLITLDKADIIQTASMPVNCEEQIKPKQEEKPKKKGLFGLFGSKSDKPKKQKREKPVKNRSKKNKQQVAKQPKQMNMQLNEQPIQQNMVQDTSLDLNVSKFNIEPQPEIQAPAYDRQATLSHLKKHAKKKPSELKEISIPDDTICIEEPEPLDIPEIEIPIDIEVGKIEKVEEPKELALDNLILDLDIPIKETPKKSKLIDELVIDDIVLSPIPKPKVNTENVVVDQGKIDITLKKEEDVKQVDEINLHNIDIPLDLQTSIVDEPQQEEEIGLTGLELDDIVESVKPKVRPKDTKSSERIINKNPMTFGDKPTVVVSTNSEVFNIDNLEPLVTHDKPVQHNSTDVFDTAISNLERGDI